MAGQARDQPMRSPSEDGRARAASAVLVLAVWAAVAAAQEAPVATARRMECSLYTGWSYVYDSNIDHSEPGLDTFGGLGGVGGECHVGSSSSGTLDLEYDGVLRRYARTTVWNVPGHDLRVSLGGLFARHVIVGSTLEAVLNGSVEDRVLRDEYSATWQLGYRFTRSTRFQLFAQYLLKRYPSPQSHSESDPRAGIQWLQRVGDLWSWTASGRYENNQADSSRYHYRGPSYEFDLSNPLWTGSRIESTVRYRRRSFVTRLVHVGTGDVLRRDSDLVAATAWHQPFGHWEIVFSYRYEMFKSNDARKEFRESIGTMTLNRWW